MNTHRLGLWAISLLYILMGATVIHSVAQPSTCSALVTQALDSVGTNCQELGRNTACYGFNRVDTRFATVVEDTAFSQPADTTPLVNIADIRTYPISLETQQWGIAVMNVQANIPNTLPGQAVTFLLMGDTQVQNDVPAESVFLVNDPVRVMVTAGQQINLRGGPGTNFNVAANANPGQPFDVDGRSADAGWLRLSGFNMWLARSLVSPLEPTVDLSSLPVVTDTPQSPMQAFYFRTGLGVPTCAEAPDVLVLQGPEQARVRLSANGAEVELGSTAVMQSTFEVYSTLAGAAPFADLVSAFNATPETTCLATTMTLLEGDAVVNGESAAHVPLGHRSRSVTCLDANNAPAFTSVWGAPERLTDEDLATFAYVEGLPLPRRVSLPTQADIDASIGRGPNLKPTPTRLPLIAIPTRVPATPDPNRPAATAVPTTQGNTDTQPSCGNFRVTSPAPFGPVGNVVTFYWDGAQNIYGYQLELSILDDGQVMKDSTRLFRVGSTETSTSVDLRRTYAGSNILSFPEIQWRVQVLVLDANNNPTTLCESPYTYNPVQ